MRANKFLIPSLIGLFLLITVVESYSQRRSSRSRTSSRDKEQTETLSLNDRLTHDIHVGNLGFNGGFYISGKYAAGYKISDPFTIGLGTKAEYGFVNSIGNDDYSIFNYGLYSFLRYRLSEQFYVKGEYNYFTAQLDRDNNADREDVWFPMIGAGYLSGFGIWKFGFEVMFTVGDFTGSPRGWQARDIYTFIEYTINFAYNF